ncbi:hypothetical protein BDN71DRAFT_1393489, partial [Pleurotus eryngii]
YKLGDEEWEIVWQLTGALLVFKDTTLFFSWSTPSLPMAIPAMDFIDGKLATFALDPEYDVSIFTALSLAKRTMNRYYDKTDHSEVYCIAIILHTWHKLVYFKKAGWQAMWITTVEQIFHNEFK